MAIDINRTGTGARIWRHLWRLVSGEAEQPPDVSVAMPSSAPDPTLALIDTLIAGFPQPALVIDGQLRIASFNAAASAIAPALFRGEPALIVLRAPELVEAIRQAAATRTVQRVEFMQRIPFDRWFETDIVPFVPPGRAGKSSDMMLLTFTDLTPLRRVEQMRSDFIANASHELRTPLAALLGFIETLQGPAKDDVVARERFLGIMRVQAARMARLIDDLLSLSRIEANAHLQPATPVELGPIVHQVADGLQPLARDRGVVVVVEVPKTPVVVAGERDELIRAVENLVENALKYGSDGKRVEIALTQSDNEARVAVRDFGPGIAPEHLPRLTERFYRVDVTDSRAQGGTGLGLALVKHVLNRHGGKLTIESKPGEGAVFTAHLPHTAPNT